MSIKRYAPKFKKLNRLKKAFWREKGLKIVRFEKQKWDNIKNFYYSRKYRFFNQDKSAYPLNRSYEDEKLIRLKKIYKFLLLDKQRLQLYYGGGRLKYYQLKNLTREALRLGTRSDVSPARSMLSLVENRLQNLLYRLGYASSLMEARRLIKSGHIEISGLVSRNCSFDLKKFDIVQLDPIKSHEIISGCLKRTILFFYFRHKKSRKKFLYKKVSSFSSSVIVNNSYDFYSNLKNGIKVLQK